MLISVLQGGLIGFILALIVIRFLVTKNEQKIRQHIRQQYGERFSQGETVAVNYRTAMEFLPQSLFQDGEIGILHLTDNQAELYLRPVFGLVNPVITFHIGATQVEWAGSEFPSSAYWIRLKQEETEHYLTSENQILKPRPSPKDLYLSLKKHFRV